MTGIPPESLDSSTNGMNPRYTFETFVVGQNNNYAARGQQGRRRHAGQNLQPAVSLRRGRVGQDPPDAVHRAGDAEP